MDEFTRERKDRKRPASNKRKSFSSKAKRPTSPKVGAFYGKMAGMERTKFISKSKHQKITSATQGLDLYKAEIAYPETRAMKIKQNKKINCK